MKPNPFLSNENIFNKAPPRRMAVTDPTSICASPLQIGSNYHPTLNSYNTSSGTTVGMTSSRPNQNTQLSSLTNKGYNGGYSDINYGESYNSQPIGNYQSSRQQSRTSIYDQSPFYPNTSSRTPEICLSQQILSSRQRSITNNYPTYSEYQGIMQMPAQKTVQNVKIPEIKSPIFEQTTDFPDININMLTACLSNNQNFDEICKLIGINAPPTSMSPPIQVSSQSNIPTQIQSNIIQNNIQQSRQEVMKLSSTSSQQQFKQFSRSEFIQEVKPQVIPSFKKQEHWQECSVPRQSKKSADIPLSPLRFQSDQQEQFDFNQNRDDGHADYNSPFQKKISRILSSKEDHMNRIYRIQALVPETGELKSIKESLQRQIAQNTNKNGIRVFLTVSEQIQARRYIPK